MHYTLGTPCFQEFAVRLRQTEPYKKRFAANAARIGKGLRALSEAEYLSLEDDKISLGEYANKYYQLKEQAKAMHKEEIIDFAMKFMMQDRPIISFYNETFGGNNENNL